MALDGEVGLVPLGAGVGGRAREVEKERDAANSKPAAVQKAEFENTPDVAHTRMRHLLRTRNRETVRGSGSQIRHAQSAVSKPSLCRGCCHRASTVDINAD